MRCRYSCASNSILPVLLAGGAPSKSSRYSNGLFNIIWLYVKGDQEWGGIVARIKVVTWTLDFIRSNAPFRI